MQIKRKKEKNIYFVLILFYIIYLYRGIVLAVNGINSGDIILNDNKAFYGSVISRKNYENSKIICDFIIEQEKDNISVKVLSHKANLYMIQLNKNNGIFDLAFLGNLGIGGEETLINKIKELNNILILIETDFENIIGQESEKAREYIINNYEKVGEIEEYSIFYIN